jgi:hypothetical protein
MGKRTYFNLGDKMILISYSNNETIEFPTISQAQMYTMDLFVSGIHAVKLRCTNASDTNHLQDYIAGIYKSIS